MRFSIPRIALVATVVLAVAAGASSGVISAQLGPREYSVTIENLMSGQPLSPPVAATHKISVNLFSVGANASADVETLAEDGDQSALVTSLGANPDVTDVVDVGAALSLINVAGDAATFTITANPGDRLSIIGMLVCTNDGFAGLNGMAIPKSGNRLYWVNAYDAGSEDNSQVSENLPDACSTLGPSALPGDPDGNLNPAPAGGNGPVALHPGISIGTGELGVSHVWALPVAKVTITRIDASATRFVARLMGPSEVRNVAGDRGVSTPARGVAALQLSADGTELSYKISTTFIVGVTAAHIHRGLPDVNGAVAVGLYGGPTTDVVQGVLTEGTLTVASLPAGFLDDLRNGEFYVNVHTTLNPAGEIRGQVGTKE
jgi:hypothetical protein